MNKAFITPFSQDVCLNHFAYLQKCFHLATDSRRQIYFNDRYNHNMFTINQILFSRGYVNNCSNVSSPYLQTINSKQDVNIINSNVSSIKSKKRK